jgi:hypothetical protein
MGYVVYTRDLQVVGYPPSGQTNAFAAANMAGVFPSHRLRGSTREASVFSASGGTRLSGLGVIIPDQAIVNYQGQWTPGSFAGAQEVVNEVIQALASDGLSVRHMTQDSGFLQNTPGVPFSLNPFNVTLQLQVSNGMGYGDPNDIISIIRHEVYTVTGTMPVSDSIPTVQMPASAGVSIGEVVQTGQPSQSVAATSSLDLGSWLTNNLALVALGAAAVIIVPRFMGKR